jgi:hypothetical protein
VILEGVVTTLNDDGTTNVAPMGPKVDPGMTRFTLRPYRTSRTYHNLNARREGVLHVTDDALLIARAAIGDVPDVPLRPADRVDGRVIANACRYYEFRVTDLDDREERTVMTGECLHHGTIREFFGFNRAKHAVIEAAILATRTDWIPLRRIQREYQTFGEAVRKTGGPDEVRALELLSEHVGAIARARGFPWKGVAP